MSTGTEQLNQGTELKAKVLELQQTLLDKHPRMPTLLREIHKTLRTYPECVTLLSEEEICTIVKGLEKQTGVELAIASTKTKSTSAATKAKLNNLDAF